MTYLLDTEVLLRLFDPSDPSFPAIRDVIKRLQKQPHRPVITAQNLSEFWNVTTRPSSARGGYGVPLHLAARRSAFLQSVCDLRFPNSHSLREWNELIVRYQVRGVQVHDAQLVAIMLSNKISTIVTLNMADFARYQEIVAITPMDLLAAWPS